MTKKIAYLTGEFPRPTDTWIQREIKGLEKAGSPVETFAIRRPKQDPVGEEQKTFLENTTYVLELCKSFKLITSHFKYKITSPINYLKTLKLAFDTKRPGTRGGLYQFIYFLEAAVLAQELEKREIDHIHNHFGDASCTVAMLAAKLAKIEYSFTLHGPGIFYEPHTWRIDKKIQLAKFVACISYFCRSQAAVFTEPEDISKLKIIHCGIETSKLETAKHSDGRQNILFVARLAELKGLADLIEATKKITQKNTNLKLTIIGDGPERERFEKLAATKGLSEIVNFTGYLSQTEVASYLSETDVLVLPSYAEGVPVTLMEALGSQVPVVATQVGGVSELVEDQTNGIIIRPGDIGQLSEALLTLIQDPELRKQYGLQGQAKVRAEFNSEVEAIKLQKLFQGK